MLNKSAIGKESKIYSFYVDKTCIKNFAEALEDYNPMYIEDVDNLVRINPLKDPPKLSYGKDYAKKSKFGGTIMPPTFAHNFRAGKWELMIKDAGLELGKLLQGEEHDEYYRVVKAGETIYYKVKLTDIYEKPSPRFGKLEFMIIDVDCWDEKNEPVMKYRQVFVVKP